VLRFSGFELDPARAELRAPDGRTVRLRPKTLEILRLLAGNAGRVLSKQQLMEAVWPNVHVGEDSLFQCIREIRTAIGDDKRQVVRAISGRGYLFQAEVTDTAAPAVVPTGESVPTAPDTTAAAGTDAEPAKRPFDFSRRRSAAFAFAAGLAVLCVAAAVWTLRPGYIFARGPTTIAVWVLTRARRWLVSCRRSSSTWCADWKRVKKSATTRRCAGASPGCPSKLSTKNRYPRSVGMRPAEVWGCTR